MKGETGREVEIAKPVVAFLQAQHATVYQEVAYYPGKGSSAVGVIDIVVDLAPALWAIEVKSSFSLALLGQAIERQRVAHKVSVAIPWRKTWRSDGRVALDILTRYGIGLFFVSSSEKNNGVKEVLRPSFQRRVLPWLRTSIRPEHASHVIEAGTAHGGQLTPFQVTCSKLRRYIRNAPQGREKLKDVLVAVGHHYNTHSSATSSIKSLIERGIIDFVTLEYEGRTPYVVFAPQNGSLDLTGLPASI